jgi:hypothetical protein
MSPANPHAAVTRRLRDEGGVALVIALFLTAAASALAASLMYLSQTETYASNNYRVMTQARYGAESGIHKAINCLRDATCYTKPTVAQLAASYTTTVSPVTYNGNPVILSANSDQAANYPDAAQQSSFAANATGTLTADHVNITYAPYAKLLSARVVNIAGTDTVVLAWEITSVGRITVGASTAEIEVSSAVETQVITTINAKYAAFATNGGCGALKFAGGMTTDSYDSTSALVAGVPSISSNNGNVGTNGNLTESGGATINGTLSTPRVGVGSCSAGNVDALTSAGGATVSGGVLQLPQAVDTTTPVLPGCPSSCPTVDTGNQNFNANFEASAYDSTGTTYQDAKVLSGTTMTLRGGHTYVFNSLTMNSGSQIVIAQDNPASPQAVTVYLKGTSATTVLDLSANSINNPSYDSQRLSFQYGGTNAVKLNGGTTTALVLNAPNADVTLNGNADVYGSILGKTVTDTGGAHLHFDRHLSGSSTTYSLGHDMLSAFTWKKS